MFEPGKKDQPGLYGETRKIEPLKRVFYAVKAQTQLEPRAEDMINSTAKQKTCSLDEAKREMRMTGKPQVVILSSDKPDGPRHAVLVTGYRTEAGRTVYDMYDPNAPSLGGSHGKTGSDKTGDYLMGKSMNMIYDDLKKEVTYEADGMPVPYQKFYGQLKYAQHDLDANQREVIKRAKELGADMKAGRGVPNVLTTAEHQTWSARVVKDLKVNGVAIFYDPALLDGGPGNADTQEFISRLMEEIEKGNSNFAMKMYNDEETFKTVSLKAVLESEEGTVGSLARIRGCIVKDDDVVLIGQETDGAVAIDRDVLTEALRTVYKTGSVPFVSLDPDPANMYGPQKVRVGGVPAELENTEFVRIMLDADYAMKLIGLGEDKHEIEGFKSWYDLIREHKATGECTNRFWLVPQAMGTGDIRENGKAFLFDSEVEVQTERLKKVGDYVMGTGRADPIAEEAAAQLTDHYSELEESVESFRELHGVFDACKLAAILRHKGIKHALLDRMMQRPVRNVPHRDHYDGIGPKQVEGTTMQIGGGATARVRISKHASIKSDALGELVDGKDTIALEATVPLPAGVNPELLVNAGIEAFTDNRLEDCVDKITRGLQEDSEQPAGYIFRGLAELQMGRLNDAAKDMDRAVGFEPKLKSTRAVVRAYSGSAAAAREDADDAIRAFPDDEEVLGQCALARMMAFDMAGAEQDLNRLLAIAPLHRDGLHLRSVLTLLNKMGPVKAHQRVVHLRRLPIPIADAFIGGMGSFQHLDVDDALEQFEHCAKLVAATPDNEEVKAFHMYERSLMGRVMAQGTRAKMLEKVDPEGAATALAAARQCTDELIRLHPEWPSGYLLRELGGRQGKPSPLEARDVLRKLANARGTDDPLLADLCATMGTDRTAAYMGFALLLGMGRPAPGDDPEQTDAAMREILKTIADQLGSGPAADLVGALIRTEDQKSSDVVRTLREAYHALPDRLPDDAATILCFNFYSTMLLGIELEKIKPYGQADPERDSLKRMAFKFLRVTDRLEGLDFVLLNHIAMLRYMVLNALAEIYEMRFDREPEVVGVREKARHEGVSEADVRAMCRRVRDQLVGEVRTNGSTFTANFVEAMLRKPEQGLCVDIFGNPTMGNNDMTGVFHDAIDSAQTEVELQTIAFVVEILGMTARAADGDESEAAVKARKLSNELQTKLKQKHLRAAARGLDWSGWDVEPAEDEVATEEAADESPAPAASSGPWATLASVPIWVWAAAWSAGMMAMTAFTLVIVAVVVRKSRRLRGRDRQILQQ